MHERSSTVGQAVSTGQKVRGAVDDASNFAIAQGLRGDLRAAGAVIQGLNNAKGIAKVALAGATAVSDLMADIRRKITEGANEGNTTQQQAILGTFAAAVPIILMSGFASPVENMPRFLQIMAEAIPLKHFLIIVQGSFLKGLPAGEIWQHAWPLMVISCVTLPLASLLIRSRLQ